MKMGERKDQESKNHTQENGKPGRATAVKLG